MARPGRRQNDAAQEPYCTYLNRDSQVIGNLVFPGAARVDGKVEGEILARDRLVIGGTAEIAARIRAPSVVVAGKVKGDIEASERIEILAPARVVGNLTSPILLVEDGAVLGVRCCMPDAASPEPASGEPELILLEDTVESEQSAPHGVSFFITKRQRADLRARGYDDALIDKMTPAQAHRILGLI